VCRRAATEAGSGDPVVWGEVDLGSPEAVLRVDAAGSGEVLQIGVHGARLVFSCGWHITHDGNDVYSLKLTAVVKVFSFIGRLTRFAELDDQVEACR
jgi:hypothetical protein